jgi:transposase-like protein
MCCQVRYASDSVALHFNVGGIHLFYQWRKAAQCDNGNFVLRCGPSVSFGLEGVQERTVYGQVSKRCTRRALDLYVGILEQEEDGLQGIPIDLADICRG